MSIDLIALSRGVTTWTMPPVPNGVFVSDEEIDMNTRLDAGAQF
jgi:hypothetical protein